MAQANDLNLQMFYALENSEKSGVPFLFMSLPGCGKSSTVYAWAEIKGYAIEILRGNSTSETEIMGYDVYSGDKKEDSAKHLIPHWASRLFQNSKEGKKTLLFLDEISGCSAPVQSALLHLVFERKIHDLKLPDDCLIVSAGNYQQSLGNEFGLIPPLMNRFCIFNLIPDVSDLPIFLSKYSGASMGKKYNFIEDKRECLKRMKSHQVKMDEALKMRAGEYFEMAIKETTVMLATTGDRPVDLHITDCQGIYSETENDAALKGFVTMRTLNYLRDVTMAAYENFGKSGIQSSNYKKMIEGLCGLGLSRLGGELKATDITEKYYKSIIQTLASIDKLSNTKIKEYEEFFGSLITNTKAELGQEEIVAIGNKIDEMVKDPEISSVSKPLDDQTIRKMCDMIKYNSSKLISFKVKAKMDIKEFLTEEKMVGMITTWNSLSDLFRKIRDMIKDSSKIYPEELIGSIDKIKESLIQDSMKLSSYSKVTATNFPDFKNLVPEIRNKF